MKIYIASSWKNEKGAIKLAQYLRRWGHEVDCFCDPSCPRYIFHWTEFVNTPEELQKYDALSFLDDERTVKAFLEDRKWLDWADAVVILMPCGKSAHLEAGYAVGQGKPVFAYGRFPKGEFDVMYGFFDGLYRIEGLDRMRDAINEKGNELCLA